MRVALTSESFLPYLSGVTVSVDALARGLGALGHDVLVVAPRPAQGSQVVAVVHAHSPFVTGLLARRLARASGAPLAFTHHTRFADYRHYLGPLAGPGAAATDAYLKSYWAGCAAIVAPS